MSSDISIYNPDTLGAPLGQYTHVTRVKANEFLFIAGMLSANREGEITGKSDFDAQCAQVFANIEAALNSAGAGFSNVVQFTTYLVHPRWIPEFMEFRLREFPKIIPEPCLPSQYLIDS